MCIPGAITSPISSKTGRSAMLGGIAGTMLAKKDKKPKPEPQPGQALANGYGSFGG